MTVTQMQTETPCKISPPGGFTDSKKGTQEEPEQGWDHTFKGYIWQNSMLGFGLK